MLVAVTRAVSPTLAECELTHLPREQIDVAKAVAEHACYEEALRSLGATVVHAPPEPTLPDAVFVEDTALALDEVAVITRPGAASRRSEIESMARVLGAYKPLARIEPPGTIRASGLYAPKTRAMDSISDRREAAPGRVITATSSSASAVSSTKTASGSVGSGGAWTTVAPSERSASS